MTCGTIMCNGPACGYGQYGINCMKLLWSADMRGVG